MGHYLNLNKISLQWFATFATSLGNTIIIDYGYYDDFTFFRFLFEFERFLGGMQPFWVVLDGFFYCMVMK
jgi:hypothetical protein